MPVETVAHTFPEHWSYGHYELAMLDRVAERLNDRWPHDQNLLFNTTWLGPKIDKKIDELAAQGRKFQRLVMTSTVDAVQNFQIYPLRDRLIQLFDVAEVYLIGNFDGGYEINLFAMACLDNFRQYDQHDLVLKSPRWRYCAYNRKPYPHRVSFVRALVDAGLEEHGVITLGRPFHGEPDHGLYRSIGENEEDYVQWGHWYGANNTEATPHEIPHDLYSLHNWNVWQNHFLHVVGATVGGNRPDIFVNQIQFKPLIGMRPFVINGQTRQYEWLRRNGFRTFNHWWPELDETLDGAHIDNAQALSKSLVNIIKQLISKSDTEIMQMYHSMLPDLIHNRVRWYQWAQEQKQRLQTLFHDRP